MLGMRLTELRKEKKLTQTDIAERLHMSRSTYAQYEVDRRVPEYATLEKMADFFGVSIDYLVGRTNERNIEKGVELEDPFKVFDLLDRYSDEEILQKFRHTSKGVEIDESRAREFISYARYLKSKGN